MSEIYFVSKTRYEDLTVLKCCLPHFELYCPPLHWSSITENIGFKAAFTLSSSSVKVGFTDITISILENSHSLLASFLRGFVEHAEAARPHGYYCTICPFWSGGNIKHKKPNAFYEPCPRPMAWARVKTEQSNAFLDWIAIYGNPVKRQSRTACSYFCRREIKNRNGLAFNPDKMEVDHLCSWFHRITLSGIDWCWWLY